MALTPNLEVSFLSNRSIRLRCQRSRGASPLPLDVIYPRAQTRLPPTRTLLILLRIVR